MCTVKNIGNAYCNEKAYIQYYLYIKKYQNSVHILTRFSYMKEVMALLILKRVGFEIRQGGDEHEQPKS